MLKKFTLASIVLMAISILALAAPPTIPSTNMQFTVIEGDRITLRFQKGNGAFRIVVLKEATPASTLPINGIEYDAGNIFGILGTEFNTNDGFVVYKGSSAASTVTVQVTNLRPGTAYFASVFEYNGTGAATEYYMIPLTGSQSTVTAPSTQGSFGAATNVAGSSATLNFIHGSGARRIILARKANPVDAVPQDLQGYTGNPNFGDGAVIANNFVVYSGASNTSVNIAKLEPNTTYHFAIFEYNGSSNPVYLKPAAVYSFTTNAGPTSASRSVLFPTIDGNRLGINFASGNGAHQLIIIKKGASVTAVPTNGILYTVGAEIAPGELVVNSLGAEREFTNLDPASVYHIRIYDFDVDANGNTYYLTSTYADASQSTAIPPVNQVSNIIIETLTGSSMSFRFTPGDSKYRLIVVKAGSPVDAVPADLTKYTGGNSNFGQGFQITPGNYVINGSTNSTTGTINMLTPGTTYHVAIWGWNGINYPVYKQGPATIAVTVPNEPSSPASNLTTSSVEGNSFSVNWTGGNGTRKLVIARKGDVVTARPVDGQTYAMNQNFGLGDAIEAGQFVVYDGTGQTFTLENLEVASNYHLAVFEYNLAGGLPDYLVSGFLAGQGSTVSAPTVQGSSFSHSGLQADRVSLSFNPGNGSARVLVMRAGSPVTLTPQDLVNYSSSGVFESGSNLGDGSYVVGKTNGSGPLNITNLKSNTAYHVAIFEYNGSTSPVYLRPANSYQFTTPTTLPLTWRYFTAKQGAAHIELQWGTTDEVQTSYFVIERQTGDAMFVALDTINALDIPGNLDYMFVDQNVIGDFVQYRIKQVDLDGAHTYSKVIGVKVKGATPGFRMYPNPATGSFRLQLPEGMKQVRLSMYERSGRRVLLRQVRDNELVETNNLPAGVYFVCFEYGSKRDIQKIFVQ